MLALLSWFVYSGTAYSSCVLVKSKPAGYCSHTPAYARGHAISHYLQIQYDNLARDAARGGGNYVAAYGELIGIRGRKLKHLSRLLKQNHAWLFAAAKADPQWIHDRINDLLRHNGVRMSSHVAQ